MNDFLGALIGGEGRITNPDAIWVPQPKQLLAHQSKAQVVGYAGEAGAGKTDLLIGELVLSPPGTPAIIFREHFRDLDALRERTREIIEPHGGVVTNDSAVYPNGSRMIFAHVTTFKDIAKWQGQAKERHLFDELAHVPEEGFRGVIGWNRSSRRQRCKVIAATNPPYPDPITGESRGEWMIDYFGPWVDEEWPEEDKAASGEVRFYVRGFNHETGQEEDFRVPDETPVLRELFGHPPNAKRPHLIPQSRTFIKAFLDDNKYIDDTYRSGLDMLHSSMRSAMRDGRWLRASAFQDEYGAVPMGWLKASSDRWQKRVDREGLIPKGAVLAAVCVDPSRGGRDMTVLMPKYEIAMDLRIEEHRDIVRDRMIAKHPDPHAPLIFVGMPKRIPGKSVPDGDTVAMAIMEMVDEHKLNPEALDSLEIRIDVIGIGASVVDSMHAMAGHLRTISLNANGKSTKRPRSAAFAELKMGNARAEWFWNLREALDPSLAELAELPPDALLRGDLKATHYKSGRSGILMEEKKEIRKRLKRSTDTGDTGAFCFADPVRFYVATA